MSGTSSRGSQTVPTDSNRRSLPLTGQKNYENCDEVSTVNYWNVLTFLVFILLENGLVPCRLQASVWTKFSYFSTPYGGTRPQWVMVDIGKGVSYSPLCQESCYLLADPIVFINTWSVNWELILDGLQFALQTWTGVQSTWFVYRPCPKMGAVRPPPGSLQRPSSSTEMVGCDICDMKCWEFAANLVYLKYIINSQMIIFPKVFSCIISWCMIISLL